MRAPIEPFLIHEVTVRPCLGRTGTGKVYGPAELHACLIVDSANLNRPADGREAVDTVDVYLAPGAVVPLDSQVVIRGRETVATAVKTADGGGLPTPDHVKVSCR